MKFNMSLLNSETEIKGNGYCCSKNITNFFGQGCKTSKTKTESKEHSLKYICCPSFKQTR